MAADNNKDALCKTQLVGLQNTHYNAKYDTWKLEKENCRSKSSEHNSDVEQNVRSLQNECDRLKEELEGQRLLNETLMIENDNIDSKWRELVTDYKHKFQSCTKLQKHSYADMATKEEGGFHEVTADDCEHLDYQQNLDDTEEKATKYSSNEVSNGDYAQIQITNGTNAETRLHVAVAVADKEKTEVQEEVLLLKTKNDELQNFCDTLSKTQERLLRALEEKERDFVRVSNATTEREQENTKLKCELSQALGKTSEFEKSLSTVLDENKTLKSELQSLQDRISALQSSNEEVKIAKDAEGGKKVAADQSETKAEPNANVKSTDGGVVLREGKSRKTPNFYRHSISVGTLPRPFSSYAAPDRKKSFSGDQSGDGDSAKAPSFLQRKVDASYLNAFKPRPFSYKPVDFSLAKKASKEGEEEESKTELEHSNAKVFEAESSSQEQESHSNASEELQAASQQETSRSTDPAPPCDVTVDGKAKIEYVSDEDDDSMALNARKKDVNVLVNLWNTKTEVTDV